MTSPVINLDQLSFDDVEDNGRFASKRAFIGERIGARYLAVSTIAEVEACTYPDSGKVSVVAGKRGDRRLRHLFRTVDGVDYYDGEEGCAPDA